MGGCWKPEYGPSATAARMMSANDTYMYRAPHWVVVGRKGLKKKPRGESHRGDVRVGESDDDGSFFLSRFLLLGDGGCGDGDADFGAGEADFLSRFRGGIVGVVWTCRETWYVLFSVLGGDTASASIDELGTLNKSRSNGPRNYRVT